VAILTQLASDGLGNSHSFWFNTSAASRTTSIGTMDATQLTLATSLRLLAADRPAEGTPAVRPFRPLLDEVWSSCAGRLSRLVLAMGVRGVQAADVLQDVYVMTLQKPPAIACETELLRWLFRVTVNRCQLEHRRRSRWQRLWGGLAETWRSESPAVARAAFDGELKHDIARALATLCDDDRALVAMRYFSELNSREIAEVVGRPEATVRSRLRAARQKLAKELGEWNDE
jgi:RNA polymerase sigma-70 factor, ECF subfamily